MKYYQNHITSIILISEIAKMSSYIVEPKTREDSFLIRNYTPVVKLKKSEQDNYMTIILHGQTSNLDKWHDRCLQIRGAISNNRVIAIQAPIEGTKLDEKTNEVVPAFSWLDFESPLGALEIFAGHLTTGIPIVKKLEKFIDEKSELYGVEKKNTAIMGHSMGGMIALQLAFNSAVSYGAVFGVGTALLPLTKKNNEPNIFLAMGDEDHHFRKKDKVERQGLSKVFNNFVKEMFSLQDVATIRRMGKKKIAYTVRNYLGEGHDISPEMWKDGVDHVVKHLVTKRENKPVKIIR